MSDDTAKGRTHRVRYPNAHEIVEVSDEVARRDFPHLFRAPANHLDTEARHVVDMVHALLDEAHAAEGPLVGRVRGVLAQVKCRTIERNDAESSLAMLRQERDAIKADRDSMLTADAAMVGELIDVLGDACLPSEIVTRVRALKEDREARAIVTRVRLLLQDLLAAGGES